MKILVPAAVGVAFLGVATVMMTAGWEAPPIDSYQRGYRGVAMEQNLNPRSLAQQWAANEVMAPPYQLEITSNDLAKTVNKNLQVLGDLKQDEFMYLMASIAQWVAPAEESCNYCHIADNMADDSKYTFKVARRMLEMTRHINADWKSHVAVAGVGVTCYTCHRGQPVPTDIWYQTPEQARGMARGLAGQNQAGLQNGLTALPYNPMEQYLTGTGNQTEIRVVSTAALPTDKEVSVMKTEWTYALMMHFSKTLGVNCTYCHNTRAFYGWDQSPPQRATAWYGIRLVRDLNGAYLEPLKALLPANRLGELGDAPKASCGTCHKGVYKPIFGAAMLKDYPGLVATPVAAKK